MSLYPAPCEVKHRSHLYLRFGYAERTFHIPKVVVGGIDSFSRDVGIGQIAFQPVPFGIFPKFVIIDGHGGIALQVQELVIATFVEILLCEFACPVCLFKTACSLVAVIRVFFSPVIGIAHQ